MDVLSQAPGLFLGLIGWAATAWLISDMTSIGVWVQRALIIFTWLLWMIPAFDAMVYQGMLTADSAVTYGTMMTVALIFFVSLGALYKRSKQ